MYTKFSSHNTDAARWLCTLKYELPPSFTPSQWLECVNGLLEGDAAIWADAHPRVRNLTTEENLQNATDADVKVFQTALCARFRPRQLNSGYNKLAKFPTKAFGQHAGEDLEAYYQRALAFMHDEGGVDLAEAPSSAREKAGLETAITRYIVGLDDVEMALGLEEDRKNNHGLGLCNIHENAKMQHWAKERRKENEQASLFGARPNAGTDSTGDLFSDGPSISRQPSPYGSLFGPSDPGGSNASGKAPDAGTTGSLFDNPSSSKFFQKAGNNSTKEAGATDSSFDDFENWKNSSMPAERPERPFRGTAASRGETLTPGGPPPQPPYPAYRTPTAVIESTNPFKPAAELSREELVQKILAEKAEKRLDKLPNPADAARNRVRDLSNPVLTPGTYENTHARAGERPFFGNGSMTGAGGNVGRPGQFPRRDMFLPGNGPFDFLNKLNIKSSDTSNERAAPRGSLFGNIGSPPANLRATPTAPTGTGGLFDSIGNPPRTETSGENVSTLAKTASTGNTDTDTESSSASDTVFGDAPSTDNTPSSSRLGGDRPGNGSG